MKLSRSIATLLMIAVIAPGSFFLAPQRAQAITFVDLPNLIQNTLQAVGISQLQIKEYILDPLAYAARTQALQAIMRTTVNWINSGFNGSPAYITNLREALRSVADYEADRFFNDLQVNGSIDSPFRDDIVGVLRTNFRRNTASNSFFESSHYTLGDFVTNDRAFIAGDWEQGGGGLSAWIKMWGNSQNNPVGAYLAAENELNRRTTQATVNRTTELNWSRGVLSWCREPEAAQQSPGANSGTRTSDPAAPAAPSVPLTPPPAGGSSDCQVETMGSIIHERITDVLGADIASLTTADEINEVVGALLSGLANKVLGGSGLRGLSEPSSGGGASPVDQAADQTANDPSFTINVNGVIDGQIQQIQNFKASWQTILSAAQAARDMCGADRGSPSPAQVLTEAEAMIRKADAAVIALQAVKVKMISNSTQDMREGNDEYQRLQASGALPTAAEMSRAVRESQTEDVDPPTLLVQMRELSRPSCRGL